MRDGVTDGPTGAMVGSGRGRWGRFLLTWFALPSALVIALLLGAVMMLALGANPITGYRALARGSVRRELCAEQHGDPGRAAAAGRGGDLHRVPGQRVQHRRRGPDRDRRPAERRDGAGVPGPARLHPDAARPPGRRPGRRDLGRDPGLLQGELQRQRDPEHHHAQPRGGPGHELPPGRPDGRPVAELGRGPHPGDEGAAGERPAADPRSPGRSSTWASRSRCSSRSACTSCSGARASGSRSGASGSRAARRPMRACRSSGRSRSR